MLNLKLALLATGAVGAVTAGGVAYATVGNSSAVPAKSTKVADAPAQAQGNHGAVPTTAPSCLPVNPGAVGKKAGAVRDKAGAVKQKVDGVKQQADGVKQKVSDAAGTAKNATGQNLPGAPNLPANVPAGKASDLKNTAAGKASDLKNTAAGKASDLKKAAAAHKPSTLPTCAPSGVPSVKPSGVPSVPVHAPSGLPSVPGVKAPSCDKVPMAIKLEHKKAKDITLPTGLHFAAAHSHSITVKSRKICGTVEKFVGTGGRFLTVERLNTPPQVTVQELANALHMEKGNVLSLSGTTTWRTPQGTGMLWISDKGYAIYISGSRAFATELPALATGLRNAQ